ncbi:MAG: FHA domain-containing protein [Cyanobacteria bacterium J06592_8]
MNRWTFKNKSVIRIGRAKDNDIVIYNSVVSRHHLELWDRGSSWEVTNLGTNGTYINSKPVNQSFIQDGTVIRLGSSGPRLMVKLDLAASTKTVRPNGSKDSTHSQLLNLNDATEIEDLENYSVTKLEFLE